MKVRDKVWVFSENRRVYPNNSGRFSGPIYSEHFYQAEIEEETIKSFIVEGKKYPKNNPCGIYTDEQKQNAIWDYNNRRKIISIIERISVEKLMEIAKSINYSDVKPS